jgi:predicted kinase
VVPPIVEETITIFCFSNHARLPKGHRRLLIARTSRPTRRWSRRKRRAAHRQNRSAASLNGPRHRGRDTIATLHLICGLPCSGKTTLAKTLERERSALRPAPDEWITRLYGADISGAALDSARAPVEAVLWDLAAQVPVLGLDVILEYGFWNRREREQFRTRAAKLGARSELHFTNAPEDELLRRLANRNVQLPPDTFWVDEARLRGWFQLFEPPDTDELRPREAH